MIRPVCLKATKNRFHQVKKFGCSNVPIGTWTGVRLQRWARSRRAYREIAAYRVARPKWHSQTSICFSFSSLRADSLRSNCSLKAAKCAPCSFSHPRASQRLPPARHSSSSIPQRVARRCLISLIPAKLAINSLVFKNQAFYVRPFSPHGTSPRIMKCFWPKRCLFSPFSEVFHWKPFKLQIFFASSRTFRRIQFIEVATISKCFGSLLERTHSRNAFVQGPKSGCSRSSESEVQRFGERPRINFHFTTLDRVDRRLSHESGRFRSIFAHRITRFTTKPLIDF